MPLVKRTWPIGTTKAAELVAIERIDRRVVLTCVSHDTGEPEGFILVEMLSRYETAAVGDRGTLRFVSGGPTGTHWVFERSET